MRLNLKYPAERLPISWDFRSELGGMAAKSLHVEAEIDSSSRVQDPDPKAILDSEPWMEDGAMFQLMRGGVVGADYRVRATVERADGCIFQKLSILPVREA